jgi:hypothetical protein
LARSWHHFPRINIASSLEQFISQFLRSTTILGKGLGRHQLSDAANPGTEDYANSFPVVLGVADQLKLLQHKVYRSENVSLKYDVQK